jgi:hypothetical protein
MITTSCRKNPKTGRIEMTILLEFDEGSFGKYDTEEIAEELMARKNTILLQVQNHLSSLLALKGLQK